MLEISSLFSTSSNKNEQQRVAVGPGNAQFMSIRKVLLWPPQLLLLLFNLLL